MLISINDAIKLRELSIKLVDATFYNEINELCERPFDNTYDYYADKVSNLLDKQYVIVKKSISK